MSIDEDLLHIAHHRGQYIAVSEKKIYTSTNGINWECRYRNTDGSFSGICSNGVIVIAVISWRAVLVSEDGREWMRHRLPPDTGNGNICFGNGQFVIAGESMIRSSDGETWCKPEFQMPMPMNGVCFGGGRFFAAGVDSTIGYATDFCYWTWFQLDWDVDFRHICFGRDFFGKERFVALSDTQVFASSGSNPESSIEWKRGSMFRNFRPKAAICAGGHFVLVGNDGSTASSGTGLAYSPIEDPPNTTTRNLNDVIYANGLLTAVGEAGTVLISSPGERWESVNAGVRAAERPELRLR